MPGQPRHNTRPHDRLASSFLDMGAWVTSQLNVALIRKLSGPLMCLAYFLSVLHGRLYNQANAHARLTGAGIIFCTVFKRRCRWLRNLCISEQNRLVEAPKLLLDVKGVLFSILKAFSVLNSSRDGRLFY